MIDRVTSTASIDELAIHGHCDPAFAGVAQEFERNFTERGDVGASACVIVGGKVVVNLWGGIADPDSGTPWQEDTVTVVMSTTKGATALCAHMLADRGLLDFDAPVANYWPEFAANGKEWTSVRMLLNHQSGLPALRNPVPQGAFCNWDLMVNLLADETPFWEPGTRIGYQAATFGWLVGEVIRRVSGKSPGTFFREEVAEPLGLDFWMGMPESHIQRVAALRPDPHDQIRDELATDPDSQSVFRLAFENSGGYFEPGGWNSPEGYRAEICAAGGITNARALAGMYAPLSLGGSIDGFDLVSKETVQRMEIIESAIINEAMGGSARFTLGFSKGTTTGIGLPASAFGHIGWGGSMGFADPDNELAFGYVMNQMNSTERFEPLARAAYRALGFHEGKYGMMVR